MHGLVGLGVPEDGLDCAEWDALGGEEATAGVPHIVDSPWFYTGFFEGSFPGIVGRRGGFGAAVAVGEQVGAFAFRVAVEYLLEGWDDGDGSGPGVGLGGFSSNVDDAVLDVCPLEVAGFFGAEPGVQHDGEEGVVFGVGRGVEHGFDFFGGEGVWFAPLLPWLFNECGWVVGDVAEPLSFKEDSGEGLEGDDFLGRLVVVAPGPFGDFWRGEVCDWDVGPARLEEVGPS